MSMDRGHIVREIRRIAAAHGGTAPGRLVFERESGIKQSEWYPNLWLRWNDAIAEAGFAPNVLQSRLHDTFVLEKYVELVRELGKIPVVGELRRKARSDRGFPSHTVFSRFGGKKGLLQALLSFCESHPGYEDIVRVCQDQSGPSRGVESSSKTKIAFGFVYLMKSGRHYKIGRTKALGRREWELGIKIPVPPRVVHSIKTDDPVGVEAYWHRRFAEKRGEGEWFELSREDIEAFKRWKTIA